MSDVNQSEPLSDNALEELLGKPALIGGEKEESYWLLHAAFKDQMKPKDFFDRIRVRELTDCFWELRRNKNSMAALIGIAFLPALVELLRQRAPPVSGIDLMFSDKPADMAREYYDGATAPKRRKEIQAVLTQYGITEEQIQAKAMELCGRQLLMFRNLGYCNDKLIRRSLREHERRTKMRAKDMSTVTMEEMR
jgi:hypothetical protein